MANKKLFTTKKTVSKFKDMLDRYLACTDKNTVHSKVLRRLEIYTRVHNKLPPQKEIEAIVQGEVVDMGVQETRHLYRDFRPGIGSGRAADWFLYSFETYSILAKQVHLDTGYSGAAVRKITKALMHIRTYGSDGIVSLRDVPVFSGILSPWVGESRDEAFPREHYAERARALNLPEGTILWALWHRWNGAQAIGQYRALELLKEIQADPNYSISGYLASSILSWKSQRNGYEGCADSEYMLWFRKHPEYWDQLLAHAPTGTKGVDPDGTAWEQVFPHEEERAKELQKKGWFHTMGVYYSVWQDQDPVLGKKLERVRGT